LEEELKKARSKIAKEKGNTVGLVCSAKAVRGMASLCPQSVEELARVPAMGLTRARLHGATFINVINKVLSEHGINLPRSDYSKHAPPPSSSASAFFAGAGAGGSGVNGAGGDDGPASKRRKSSPFM